MPLSGPTRVRPHQWVAKENFVTRKDHFTWNTEDIEVHLVTARAIAYAAARNRLREVDVIDADPRQAAHRAIGDQEATSAKKQP
jgi:hypothetical protein